MSGFEFQIIYVTNTEYVTSSPDYLVQDKSLYTYLFICI